MSHRIRLDAGMPKGLRPEPLDRVNQPQRAVVARVAQVALMTGLPAIALEGPKGVGKTTTAALRAPWVRANAPLPLVHTSLRALASAKERVYVDARLPNDRSHGALREVARMPRNCRPCTCVRVPPDLMTASSEPVEDEAQPS